ncbi:MAG: rRNA-processing protein and EBNA1-binding protein ebp2 [Vezdaea acicularis]|nr:MAG: rRNA-processing protein and EBNA1-binding protein ebp2 [Vezdaea acicularis]
MVKKGKLKQALDAQRGVDFQKEHQAKLRKLAEKAKKAKKARVLEEKVGGDVGKVGGAGLVFREEIGGDEDEDEGGMGAKLPLSDDEEDDEDEGEQSDNEGEDGEDSFADSFSDDDDDPIELSTPAPPVALLEDPNDSDTSSSSSALSEDAEASEHSSDAESQASLPLSALSPQTSDTDLIPHQRLTINNHTALTSALTRIRLPYATLPFSAHQSLTSPSPISIPDASDDLNRELAFYSQSLSAAQQGRQKLTKEGIPFTRPPDYFAEMVKSDAHMTSVRQKVRDAKANQAAAAEARKQRDLKKFGKAVQVAKLQERAKERREGGERVKALKRKRRGEGDTGGEREEEMFDVGLEEEVGSRARKGARAEFGGSKEGRQGGAKRQKMGREGKDRKFGFGGKKRFAKSGDAVSTADMTGFSAKKMKGGTKRVGKSRRNAGGGR